MSPGLTSIGYLWSFLSIVAAITVFTGFYSAHWIRGNLTEDGLKFTLNRLQTTQHADVENYEPK